MAQSGARAIPATAETLDAVRAEARNCRRCALWTLGTQTVFGEGPADAAVMLVGEQPGDREDIEGRPFVGPAGLMLDRALAAAGIDRQAVYVTNAVKHFKNEPRGKKRLHKTPDAKEIEICRFWLDREIALIDPRLVVAMGGTAARALAGKAVTISRSRGRTIHWPNGRAGLVTVHPSYLLRLPDAEARHAAFDAFVADLGVIGREVPLVRAT